MIALPMLLALVATGEPAPSTGSAALQQAAAPESQPPAPAPRAGASRTSFEGCLASKDRQAAGTRRTLPDLDQQPPRVQVEPVPGGLVLVDERDHNCCAEARVTSELRGRAVEIRVELSGRRCRCQCRSTIRTTVGAPPGRHTVTLVVDDHGRKQVAYQGEVVIPRR